MDEKDHENKTDVPATGDKVLLVEPDHADVLASAEALLAHARPLPEPVTEDEFDMDAEIWRYAKIHGISYRQAFKRMFGKRNKKQRVHKPKPVRR